MTSEQSIPIVQRTTRRTRTVEGLVFTLATALVVVTAIWTKQAAVRGWGMMPLSQIDSLSEIDSLATRELTAPDEAMLLAATAPGVVAEETMAADSGERFPIETRWFDGRPVRPARVLWMTVTGYSPDERSCGEFADGQTATLHSVWTNGMKIVAADTSVLEYGSMLTVPGYADDSVVPVLDCGGAIKGARLDVLFATHKQAMRWGVRQLPVVVWEYVDGEPAPNPREVR